ncbi:MAG: N-acetyl-gamma-glutamyl-phosphate reductase, partial [Labilithrix sp.]|nr:N-acetyl-gamma-glutamyl-phosphate reductase [Labilithrix sp.]
DARDVPRPAERERSGSPDSGAGMKRTVGLIGARGYVGRELTTLVESHGDLDLRLAVSQRDGKSPADVAGERLDAYVLALPNGASEPFVEAITAARPEAVIVDLSADHRFSSTWVYGQPERHRAALRGARRIANPGCYATAMQLALAPLVPLVEGPANVFGVSGYSGAGTTPSPKNDPEALRDNLMPYALAGHVHEREVAAQLGCRLFFMPHVAPFFRGLTVTVSVALARPATRGSLEARFREVYDAEPLVRFHEDVPLVRDIAGKHDVAIGGLTVSDDERHAVVVATIDNLLGGAATQALRNLNLALGFPENQGLTS